MFRKNTFIQNVSKIQTFNFAAGGRYIYHRNVRS